MSHDLVKLLVWAIFIGVVFALLWWKGYLVELRNYIQATREELRKCTWPSWDELKGSTVVVAISIVILGGFTVGVDALFVGILYRLFNI